MLVEYRLSTFCLSIMNPCEWMTRTKVDLVAHESVAYIDRHHRTLKLHFVDFHDFRHLSEPLFIFGAGFSTDIRRRSTVDALDLRIQRKRQQVRCCGKKNQLILPLYERMPAEVHSEIGGSASPTDTENHQLILDLSWWFHCFLSTNWLFQQASNLFIAYSSCLYTRSMREPWPFRRG